MGIIKKIKGEEKMVSKEFEKLVREYEGMCYIQGLAVADLRLMGTVVKAVGVKEYGNGKLVIPWFVNVVGEGMMFGIKSGRISGVVMEEGVEVIEAEAFSFRGVQDKTKLERLFIPDSIRKIQRGAFAYVQCKGIRVPLGVVGIGEGAYEGSGLTDVALKAEGCVVADRAFYGCKELKGVFVGKGVKFIDENSFKSCDSIGMVVVEDLEVRSKFANRFNANVVVVNTDNKEEAI